MKMLPRARGAGEAGVAEAGAQITKGRECAEPWAPWVLSSPAGLGTAAGGHAKANIRCLACTCVCAEPCIPGSRGDVPPQGGVSPAAPSHPALLQRSLWAGAGLHGCYDNAGNSRRNPCEEEEEKKEEEEEKGESPSQGIANNPHLSLPAVGKASQQRPRPFQHLPGSISAAGLARLQGWGQWEPAPSQPCSLSWLFRGPGTPRRWSCSP